MRMTLGALGALTLLLAMIECALSLPLSNDIVSMYINEDNMLLFEGIENIPTDLWSAKVLKAGEREGSLLYISASSVCHKKSREVVSKHEVVLHFKGIQIEQNVTMDVDVSIGLKPHSEVALIYLTFHPPTDDSYKLWEWSVHSPLIQRRDAHAHIIENVGFGVLHSCTNSKDCFPDFNNIYPQSTFQFLALYHDNSAGKKAAR
jgi:hypothetical protein